MTEGGEVTIQLLFVDQGSYHLEEIQVREDLLSVYDRLIDFLREEPSVLRVIHIDLNRLCSARVLDS